MPSRWNRIVRQLLVLASWVGTLGLANIANANGWNGLAVVFAPILVELCSEKRPEVSSELRDAYAAWSRRLTPEHRQLQEQVEKASNAQKKQFYDGPRAQFDKLSEEELVEHCDTLRDYLLGEDAPTDPAFSTPTATWNTFVQALRTGDRRTALRALEGNAKEKFRDRITNTDSAALAEWANDVESFALGDRYGELQDALVVRKDKRAGMVTFGKKGPNWRIIEM